MALRFPFTGNGMRSFTPPLTFSARKAVTSGDARESNLSGPKKLMGEFHVNCGHASAQQLEGVLADSGGDEMHPPHYGDGVLGNCEV